MDQARSTGPGRLELSAAILKVTAMDFLVEFWIFLRTRKKLWLLPITIVMLLLGGLLIFAQGSAVAPFIYTIF